MSQQLELVDNKPQAVQVSANQTILMMQYAIEKGADIAVIERLYALQQTEREAQAKAAFNLAISKAKSEIPIIIKNRSVSFGAGKAAYEYEDLGSIAKVVDPILSQFGLSYRFRTECNGNMITVFCIVSHKDGYSEENSITAQSDTSGNKNSIQGIGSTQTYLQRYTLKAALGLAASKDDDAKSANKEPEALITESQLLIIRELLEKTESDIAQFCKWAKIEALVDIKARDFPSVEKMLLKKLGGK